MPDDFIESDRQKRTATAGFWDAYAKGRHELVGSLRDCRPRWLLMVVLRP
jgi:hypothetical protein